MHSWQLCINLILKLQWYIFIMKCDSYCICPVSRQYLIKLRQKNWLSADNLIWQISYFIYLLFTRGQLNAVCFHGIVVIWILHFFCLIIRFYADMIFFIFIQKNSFNNMKRILFFSFLCIIKNNLMNLQKISYSVITFILKFFFTHVCRSVSMLSVYIN